MVPTLISGGYVEQNKALHESDAAFGGASTRYLPNVAQVCQMAGTRDVLDYGCGKGYLVEAMRQNGYAARGYDPAVEKYSKRPEPADVVVCTDVLEHIEPEYLEAVLDDIQSLTRKAAFMVISTRPAKKILADGRNAHLIVKDGNAWLSDLIKRFKVSGFRAAKGGIVAVLER